MQQQSKAIALDPGQRTAKLFRNGKNQAVRLPKDFEIQASEVIIRKQGTDIILTFMLDTNICIAIVKGHPGVRSRISGVAYGQVVISGIVLAELAYGVKKSIRKGQNSRALADFLGMSPGAGLVLAEQSFLIGFRGPGQGHTRGDRFAQDRGQLITLPDMTASSL